MSNPSHKKTKTAAGPSSSSSTSARSTIGNRHAGTALLTETQHGHIARVAAANAQLDVTRLAYEELKERDEEVRASHASSVEQAQQSAAIQREFAALSIRHAEQSAAFRKCVGAMNERVHTIKNDLKLSGEATATTDKIVSSLQAAGHDLGELRESLGELVGIDGPLHNAELANLRKAYELSSGEVETLKRQNDALQALLQKSWVSRASDTAAIEGFPLQPLKSHPLQNTPDIIVAGVQHLTAENQQLRQHLADSKRTVDTQAREIEMLRAQLQQDNQQHKQQLDETKQMFEDFKTGTTDANEVFRQAAEQQAVKNLEQHVTRLELEKTQAVETAEKATSEAEQSRTRLHWLEEQLNEQESEATRMQKKLLDGLNKERMTRVDQVLEKTHSHAWNEAVACNERDRAVARVDAAEQTAKDAESRMQELEKQVTGLNSQLETERKLYEKQLQARADQVETFKDEFTQATTEQMQIIQDAHAAELQAKKDESQRHVNDLVQSGNVSKAAAEAYASRMAEEVVQEKVEAAEQLAATAEQKRGEAEQKRVEAEQNVISINLKMVAAEAKIEAAEVRATAAEDKVKALEGQLRLSQEATESAKAREIEAAENSKKAIDEANTTVESTRKSQTLSEITQLQLLRNTSSVNDQIDTLKAKIVKQDEQLVHMGQLKDELARTKTDLDAHKRSLGEWRSASKERDQRIEELETIIAGHEEKILELQALIEGIDQMSLAETAAME